MLVVSALFLLASVYATLRALRAMRDGDAEQAR